MDKSEKPTSSGDLHKFLIPTTSIGTNIATPYYNGLSYKLYLQSILYIWIKELKDPNVIANIYRYEETLEEVEGSKEKKCTGARFILEDSNLVNSDLDIFFKNAIKLQNDDDGDNDVGVVKDDLNLYESYPIKFRKKDEAKDYKGNLIRRRVEKGEYFFEIFNDEKKKEVCIDAIGFDSLENFIKVKESFADFQVLKNYLPVNWVYKCDVKIENHENKEKLPESCKECLSDNDGLCPYKISGYQHTLIIIKFPQIGPFQGGILLVEMINYTRNENESTIQIIERKVKEYFDPSHSQSLFSTLLSYSPFQNSFAGTTTKQFILFRTEKSLVGV